MPGVTGAPALDPLRRGTTRRPRPRIVRASYCGGSDDTTPSAAFHPLLGARSFDRGVDDRVVGGGAAVGHPRPPEPAALAHGRHIERSQRPDLARERAARYRRAHRPHLGCCRRRGRPPARARRDRTAPTHAGAPACARAVGSRHECLRSHRDRVEPCRGSRSEAHRSGSHFDRRGHHPDKQRDGSVRVRRRRRPFTVRRVVRRQRRRAGSLGGVRQCDQPRKRIRESIEYCKRRR